MPDRSAHRENGLVVVGIGGVWDRTTAEDTESWISHELADAKACILDLTEAAFLDSAAIHTLFHLAASARAEGRRLLVVGPRDTALARALEIASLSDLIPILQSVEQARALHSTPPEQSP